jgi:hypothetical protein
MPPELQPLQPPPRRRRRWRIVLVLVLLFIAAVVGGGWWALSTNQTGHLISRLFSERLPGHLEIDHSEFTGVDGLVLTGIRFMRQRGETPAITIPRIVISGELWQGRVNQIRIEGLQFDATYDSVRFIHKVILAEVAQKSSGRTPRLLHLDISGGVSVNGEVVIDEAKVGVDATGPKVVVEGTARYAGQPISVQVKTSGSNEEFTNIKMLEGRLPVWRSCDWLAALKLLPELPQEARAWVPEHAELGDSVVIADRAWEHFTGEAHAKWTSGGGQAKLNIDQRFVRLGDLTLQDAGIITLNGEAVIDTDERKVAVSAKSWSPGPRLPIPAIVPTVAILAAMPRAQLDGALIAGAWDLNLRLSGTGETALAWSAGHPLTVDSKGVALSLLQPFVPRELTLAAGSANNLHAEVGASGLTVVTATVEQARVLWQGWALGGLDGRVALRVVPTGIDLDVTLPVMGKASWRSVEEGGLLNIDLTNAEAFVVRLKGPQVLPELSGAVLLDAKVRQTSTALLADIVRLRLKEVGITDALRHLDNDLSGTVSLHGARANAHLLGRITSGEVRIANVWHNLAKHRPRFNAEVSLANGLFLADNILIRATDAAGEPLIDGYSAGIRGSFSLSELSGTIHCVADHADLDWINTLIPNTDSTFGGEGAVTVTTNLLHGEIDTIKGHFMPLDAHLSLGQFFNATGIKGAVEFRIARPSTEALPTLSKDPK